jgi:hypothetical protein
MQEHQQQQQVVSAERPQATESQAIADQPATGGHDSTIGESDYGVLRGNVDVVF